MSATVTARGVDSSLEDWMLEAVVASGVGVAQRDALGTSARVVVWPPESLSGALAAVEEVPAPPRPPSEPVPGRLGDLVGASSGRWLVPAE